MADTDALKVVVIISPDRALCESMGKIVVRAKCRAVPVPDCAAAERAIEHLSPVLILVDPLHRYELSAGVRAICAVVEIPVRTSGSGVRRLAKPSTEAVHWLTDIISERCAASH